MNVIIATNTCHKMIVLCLIGFIVVVSVVVSLVVSVVLSVVVSIVVSVVVSVVVSLGKYRCICKYTVIDKYILYYYPTVK